MALTVRPDRTGLWLLLGVWLVFLFTSPGGLESGDAVLRYETARSWLAGRGGALPERVGWAEGAVLVDGTAYSFYGPLQSVCMVPVVLAVRLLPDFGLDVAVVETFALSLVLFPMISSAVILLLYLALRQLGHERKVSFLASLTVALASLFFHYARSAQEESLVALGFALWLYGAARLAAGRSFAITILAAGGATALATRWATTPQLLVLALATLILLWHQRLRLSKLDLAMGVILVVLCTGLLLSYNHARFGDWAETGYGLSFQHQGVSMFSMDDYGRHLAALLVSPYRGLLWYSPIVIAAVAGGFYLRPGNERLIGLAGLAVLGTAVLLFAAFRFWSGGHSWGPRFLTSPQVLLAPALAAFVVRRPRWLILLPLLVGLQLFSTVLPASTEEYVWFNLNKERAQQCSEWRLECTAVPQRIPRAIGAIANTFADDPGVVMVGRPATVAPEIVLSTSDYRTLYWWPVRIGYRLQLYPTWVGLLVCGAGLSAAAAALLRAWRSASSAQLLSP